MDIAIRRRSASEVYILKQSARKLKSFVNNRAEVEKTFLQPKSGYRDSAAIRFRSLHFEQKCAEVEQFWRKVCES